MACSKCNLSRALSCATFILSGLSLIAAPARAADGQPSSPAKASDSAEQKQQAQSNYGKLPMSFEPNVGQAPGDARFISHGRGYTVLLTDQGATVQMDKRDAPTSFRMKLLGSKPASASAADQLPGHSNYYIGSDPSSGTSACRSSAKSSIGAFTTGSTKSTTATRGRWSLTFRSPHART
jgi:hypothetical protein